MTTAKEKALEAWKAEAMEVLLPFANAVFNDNGDITVDRSTVNYDDFVKAYFTLRAARRLVEKEDERG
jgi:hypothetical protein